MVFSRAYNHVPGTGNVRQWIVNGECTEVAIIYKSGQAVEGALNQYKWEVGGNFYESAAQIGDRLLVTHDHGMFTLSKNLKVIREVQYSARRHPPLYWVAGDKQRRVREFSKRAAFDYPNQSSKIRGWNGTTAFLTYTHQGKSVHLLVNKNLKPIACFDFGGNQVEQFIPSDLDWLIQVSTPKGFDLQLISDSGRFSKMVGCYGTGDRSTN